MSGTVIPHPETQSLHEQNGLSNWQLALPFIQQFLGWVGAEDEVGKAEASSVGSLKIAERFWKDSQCGEKPSEGQGAGSVCNLNRLFVTAAWRMVCKGWAEKQAEGKPSAVAAVSVVVA